MIECSKKITLLLSGGFFLIITDAFICPKSQRNLLSFKDINKNGYHIETISKEGKEFLFRTCIISRRKYIKGELSTFTSESYYTNIGEIEANDIVNQ